MTPCGIGSLDHSGSDPEANFLARLIHQQQA